MQRHLLHLLFTTTVPPGIVDMLAPLTRRLPTRQSWRPLKRSLGLKRAMDVTRAVVNSIRIRPVTNEDA